MNNKLEMRLDWQKQKKKTNPGKPYRLHSFNTKGLEIFKVLEMMVIFRRKDPFC